MEAWSALAACRNAEQILDWQGSFAAKTTEHCTAEMARLSQLIQDMASGEPKA